MNVQIDYIFNHTLCVNYLGPLDHSSENFLQYDFVNQGEMREFPGLPNMMVAIIITLKIQCFSAFFFLLWVFWKNHFLKNKIRMIFKSC
jgi:hypothetical protein